MFHCNLRCNFGVKVGKKMVLQECLEKKNKTTLVLCLLICKEYMKALKNISKQIYFCPVFLLFLGQENSDDDV